MKKVQFGNTYEMSCGSGTRKPKLKNTYDKTKKDVILSRVDLFRIGLQFKLLTKRFFR